MKSENGLTFIATIFIVIIIALMVFVAVYYTRMQVNKEIAEDIKTNMLLVQAKVKKISGEHTLDKKADVLVGTKLADMQEDEVIKEFLEKELFDKDEKDKEYYVLNQDNLNELELNIVIDENSYYVVEYTASDVYYTKGFTDENGDVHYKAEQVVEEKNDNNTENSEEVEKNTETNKEEAK